MVWGLLQRRRIRGWYLYLPLAVICWWCVWQSGVHATVAGVLLGLLTRSSATDASAPVDAWEHAWRPISAGFAVPIFALFAAGVAVSPATLAGSSSSRSGSGWSSGWWWARRSASSAAPG